MRVRALKSMLRHWGQTGPLEAKERFEDKLRQGLGWHRSHEGREHPRTSSEVAKSKTVKVGIRLLQQRRKHDIRS